MVTMKDIANALDISPTTVSLVLNQKPNRISKSTKEKILFMAQQMNYCPNQLAVGLAKKRTKTIGLILPDISNIFFAELARGIDDQARERGWNIIFSSSSDLFERDLENIRTLYARGVDVITIAMASQATDKNIQEYRNLIDSLHIPFIFVDRYEPSLSCSSIMLNQKKGLYLATKHLLELGHEKTACVIGPMNLNTTKERLEGYALAYREANIPIPADYFFEGDFSFHSGSAAVEKFIRLGFTAILAFNDMMAYGIYKKLKELNIRIPEDISVVGFDDLFFSELSDPPLTTIRQPANEIGMTAAIKAIEEAEQENPSKQNIFFEPLLVVRESTQKNTKTESK